MVFHDLIAIDKWLFRLLNGTLHHPWLDAMLPVIRTSQTWYPLYVFLILFVWLNFKKGMGYWILFFALLPVLTDFVSSTLIKEHIFRLRPCNDPAMQSGLRFLLSYKPQSSSFTSSHATNHFALAVFFYVTLRQLWKNWALLFFLWASLIGWAQIYVGVHYPADVLAGALLGSALGWVVSLIFIKKIPLTN